MNTSMLKSALVPNASFKLSHVCIILIKPAITIAKQKISAKGSIISLGEFILKNLIKGTKLEFSYSSSGAVIALRKGISAPIVKTSENPVKIVKIKSMTNWIFRLLGKST